MHIVWQFVHVYNCIYIYYIVYITHPLDTHTHTYMCVARFLRACESPRCECRTCSMPPSTCRERSGAMSLTDLTETSPIHPDNHHSNHPKSTQVVRKILWNPKGAGAQHGREGKSRKCIDSDMCSLHILHTCSCSFESNCWNSVWLQSMLPSKIYQYIRRPQPTAGGARA